MPKVYTTAARAHRADALGSQTRRRVDVLAVMSCMPKQAVRTSGRDAVKLKGSGRVACTLNPIRVITGEDNRS
ncbi:hypothetical protein MOD31_12125 [Paenarthrobacter sp. TYUT067]|jgi:hypothetical protein|uniref:hypothetical protein n=1 Tax=Paenarthrobacter sp. TYUT067 TaxID=2926245 RepID=UPI00203020A7|nr:hypothetical protein [Paenarthrobacter sp. TYUT067]MCM0616774.1 hypothetical protein [Paenarthrobacter sp. TYUT067]